MTNVEVVTTLLWAPSAPPGCFWLLLASPGPFWLLLAPRAGTWKVRRQFRVYFQVRGAPREKHLHPQVQPPTGPRLSEWNGCCVATAQCPWPTSLVPRTSWTCMWRCVDSSQGISGGGPQPRVFPSNAASAAAGNWELVQDI